MNKNTINVIFLFVDCRKTDTNNLFVLSRCSYVTNRSFLFHQHERTNLKH